MRKGLQPPPQRLASAARPSLPPAPRSHCSDDSLDDLSTTGSVDDGLLQPPEQQQASPVPDRPRARKEGSVQVAVRVRPLLPREIAASQRACVQHPSDDSIELLDADKRFTFDHVFPQSATQSELYDKALQPWLDSFLQGFNVTVIAYGQTGSGKTFTMGNSMPSSEMVASHLFARASSTETSAAPASRTETTDELKADDGLIPRFLYQLFERLNKAGKDEHQVSVSFLEIYGEEIHDLLQNTKQNNDSALESLQLREGRGGVYVQGLTEVKVATRVGAMEQMRVGSLRRITGRTEMNEHSSRSHAVYTIKVVRRVSQGGKDSPRQAKESKGILQGARLKTRRSSTDSGSDSGASSPRGASSRATVVSKLTFVDLAGSERLKKTLAEGNRMKEGIQINVGLLALGNVINALGDDRRRGATHLHIPYRSSKLTRLLQDALGGNSRTLFIACVSPAGSNLNETHNTLQYANRAKNIQNKAVKNIDSRSAELLHLKAFNDLLRREFIKACFVRPQETGLDTADARVETIMADPKVQGFLKKLEEIASSNTSRDYSPGTSYQASVEVQRAFSSLASYFPDAARAPRADVPETMDELGDEVDETSRDPAFSNDDESLGDTSEESEGESAVQIAPFSLHKLSWALDIITVTLELRGLQKLVSSHQDEFASRLFDLDRSLHRKKLIRTGLKAALEKMSAKHLGEARATEVQKTMKRYAEKINRVDEEILALKQQKAGIEGMLAKAVSQCSKDMQRKRERLLKLRQKTVDVFGTTLVSPLDVMIRASELPGRFGIKFLAEATDFLIGEEKAMAAYLDENMMSIAFIASLFPKDEMASSEAFNLVEEISSRMQTSLDNEHVNAALSHEIRQRAAILQNLAQGWIAGPDENSTELEYLAANQQQLKECDENIADLSAALSELPSYLESISAIVESISSLPLAKSTLRRLIELLYSQMRLNIAIASEVDTADVEEPSVHQARQTQSAVDLKELLQKEKKNHDDELKDVMDIVAAAVPDISLNRDQTDQLAQKYAAANAKIKELEEIERCHVQKLEKSEAESSKMEQRIRELEESLKANELKRESIRLMDRCQEIWTELGLSPEETASKFNDINALLMKKCSDELEGLEAARVAIQARIDDAYDMIEVLEAALDVDEPTDLQTLHSVAGKTLLEQEKYLIRRSADLTDEMWLRVDARVAGLSRVQELVDDMKLEDVADFRHVPHERLHNLDIGKVQAHLVKLQQFKELKDEASAGGLFPKKLLESLVVDPNDKVIARECLAQDEVLLSSLLSEKAKRVAETEQLLNSIRSVSGEMKMSHDNVLSVLHAVIGAHTPRLDTEGETEEDQVRAVASLILESGGRIDVSTGGIQLLADARDCFVEIYEGRSNALSFLFSTLQEATSLTKSLFGGSPAPQEPSPPKPQTSSDSERCNLEIGVSKECGCHRDALLKGKEKLDALIQPIEGSIRALLYSTNDDFLKYGIDSNEQRVSFFLGRQDSDESTSTRDVLAKYVSFADEQDGSESGVDFSTGVEFRQDSLLSELDPFYDEFCAVYSVSYGTQQLQRVKDAISHVAIVQQTVESAQKRLKSLSTIMGLYSEINQYREKISEFEASASKKDRLFGNSLRLLEEERFRKTVAKRYPLRIAALKTEVQKWLHNDGGDYDLNILGQDMKNMLMDMMNTDTELMHLDLGVVGSSRQSARRGSKTSTLAPALSSSSLSSLSSNNSSASASASVANSNQLPQQETTGARPVRAQSLSKLAPAAAKKRP